jgi:hypothetical protein
MAITIQPNGQNEVKLKLTGPLLQKESVWVAAKLNALIAEFNTRLHRREPQATNKLTGVASQQVYEEPV